MLEGQTAYVFAAYAITALVLIGLCAWTFRTYRSERRALAAFEHRTGQDDLTAAAGREGTGT